MKAIIPPLVTFTLLGCSGTTTESDTFLVCKGVMTRPIQDEKQQRTFTIVKVGEKVTKVRAGDFIYTLDKANISTTPKEGPIYRQLIVEPDKVVLRTKATGGEVLTETVLFNTGAYRYDSALLSDEGQCAVVKKLF